MKKKTLTKSPTTTGVSTTKVATIRPKGPNVTDDLAQRE
jgi:hypothetical protein